ncbi:MAG: GntR family transcriptional regulator [Eubacteriales bacterium]
MNQIEHTISPEKDKLLKHVKVYNQLYVLIQDGTYPIGTQLPSEPDLAAQMDVSRMTLRRALALLQEDNLIQNVRGKGNFIKDHTHSTISSNTQLIQHPVAFCCKEPWDVVELEFRIDPCSDFYAKALQCTPAAVVVADRWYKLSNSTPLISYTLSFIPIEKITDYQVDLNDMTQLETYLQNTVYCESTESTALFSHTTTGNFTSTKYLLSETDSFMLIVEALYDKKHTVMAYNKHYIPIDSFQFTATANKR